MQPIEYCLDITLQKLKDSSDTQERPPLNATELLAQFQVPQGRHEFFKGILNILIDDGYADFLDPVTTRKAADLETYEKRIVIIPKGYYHLDKKGYTGQTETNENALRVKENRERWFLWGTWAAALAGFLLAIIEYVKLSIDYHWFPFCH